MRQTQLGSIADGTLTIFDPDRPRLDIQTQNSLLRLPEELLALIVECANMIVARTLITCPSVW
jgi:hypothetical protein